MKAFSGGSGAKEAAGRYVLPSRARLHAFAESAMAVRYKPRTSGLAW